MIHPLAKHDSRRGWILDLLGFALLSALALLALAPVLLAQAMRHGALLIAVAVERLALKIAHGRFHSALPFGDEKLRRCCECLLGIMLIVGAGWIIGIGPSLTHEYLYEVLLLAPLAAVTNFFWLLWTWKDEGSRHGSRSINVVAQVLLTLAALSYDKAFSAHADLLAAVMIAGLAFYHGLCLAADAIHELVDAPPHSGRLNSVFDALHAAGLDREEIRSYRSREAGPRLFLELQVEPESGESPVAFQQRLHEVAKRVMAAVPGLELTYKLSSFDQERESTSMPPASPSEVRPAGS